jgi:hypothetical protein
MGRSRHLFAYHLSARKTQAGEGNTWADAWPGGCFVPVPLPLVQRPDHGKYLDGLDGKFAASVLPT